MDVLGSRVALGLARRLCGVNQRFFGQKLSNPVFVVGFNNSGKSSAVRALEKIDGLTMYPGEGNGELWFRGHFPWISSSADVAPIWVAPNQFIDSVKDHRDNCFLRSRAQLGAFQWLHGGSNLVNDSGMLAALGPEIAPFFPDAKYIHFLRDGRLASYITARLEWARIIRSPSKYIEYHCPISFIDVLRKMAEYWVWTIDRMDRLAQMMPGSVLELWYEDWWSEPEPMVQSVAEFLGLTRPEIAPPSTMKADLTGRLLSEISCEELEMLQSIIGPTMLRKGFSLEETTVYSLERF